jgi:hypothetical protein
MLCCSTLPGVRSYEEVVVALLNASGRFANSQIKEAKYVSMSHLGLAAEVLVLDFA